jgi:SAM-dependent methyltransferase
MTTEEVSGALRVYERKAGFWADLRDQVLVERDWLDRFCALIPAGGAVLDIGCGQGLPIGRELAQRGFDLTGVDGAEAMLTLFRRNLPGVPAICLDMRDLALGRRFDGMLAWDSLFHLPPADQRGMFARFRDHAASGAALMFTSGNEEGVAIGELDGEPLYHGSLDTEEYRHLLTAHRFEVVEHAVTDASCGGRTIWLARQSA